MCKGEQAVKDKRIITDNIRYGVFRDRTESTEHGDAAFILIAVFRVEDDADWYARHRQKIDKYAENLYIIAPVKTEATAKPDRLRDIAEREERIFFGQDSTENYYSLADALAAEDW